MATKKHSAKADRSLRRRGEKKVAELRNGATNADTGERYQIQVLDSDSSQIRRRAPAVEEGLKLLKLKSEDELVESEVKKRKRYASMRAHKEIAATVLAVGGSRKMAARKAGVSIRQIQKYFTDPDFRERIQEIQELASNRIRGRVMKEVTRRTGPKMIKRMELLDLLRVGDRFGLGRGKASAISITNIEQNNYEALFNEVFLSDDPNAQQYLDTEEEGADFPAFEPTRVALSGGDSPVEG